MESYPYPVKEGQRYINLTSTLATFLFSSHPKRERNREAYLNYYASAYNWKETTIIPKDKTKSNMAKNTHP